MKKLSAILLIVFLAAGLTLSGCGGKKSTATVEASTTTLGQELIDLQTAYEKGIITEKEYNDLKNKAIKKYK